MGQTIEIQKLTEREPLLGVADVATRLGMSEQFVRDHVARHQPIIPSIRMGSTIKFRAADIDAFIEAQSKLPARYKR